MWNTVKVPLLRPQTQALAAQSPSIFQKELLDNAEHCDLVWNRVGVWRVVYQKIDLFGYKYIS